MQGIRANAGAIAEGVKDLIGESLARAWRKAQQGRQLISDHGHSATRRGAESRGQGLTDEAAAEQVREAKEKVKRLADAARDAAGEQTREK